MTDHLTQILQALAAVIAALAALWAAIKSHQAAAAARSLRARMEEPLRPGLAPPGLNAGDLFRYAALIQELLALVKQVGRLNMGESIPLPGLKLDLPGGERIELDATKATRTR